MVGLYSDDVREESFFSSPLYLNITHLHLVRNAIILLSGTPVPRVPCSFTAALQLVWHHSYASQIWWCILSICSFKPSSSLNLRLELSNAVWAEAFLYHLSTHNTSCPRALRLSPSFNVSHCNFAASTSIEFRDLVLPSIIILLALKNIYCLLL